MSSLLLAAGIILVFTGVGAALGFTPLGLLASATAVVSLLYAGAMWSRRSAPSHGRGIILFDPHLEPVAGGEVLATFADATRRELRTQARAALAGERVRFEHGQRTFLATPVVSETGGVLYALVVENASVDGLQPASELATVASSRG